MEFARIFLTAKNAMKSAYLNADRSFDKPANVPQPRNFNRRQFLKVALQTGAILSTPQVVRAAVLGKDGAVPPSEQIRLGAIGIGNRGWYDLGCFLEEPDVRFIEIGRAHV